MAEAEHTERDAPDGEQAKPPPAQTSTADRAKERQDEMEESGEELPG